MVLVERSRSTVQSICTPHVYSPYTTCLESLCIMLIAYCYHKNWNIKITSKLFVIRRRTLGKVSRGRVYFGMEIGVMGEVGADVPPTFGILSREDSRIVFGYLTTYNTLFVLHILHFTSLVCNQNYTGRQHSRASMHRSGVAYCTLYHLLILY